jgi:DNA polymerase-1
VARKLPFKPTAPAAKKFFFIEPGRKPYKGKRTDNCLKNHPSNCVSCPQLDEEVQDLLCQEGVDYAEFWREHESLKSAETKWYEPWARRTGPDGRIRCTYRQYTVITGRLSAEYNNLLAIPKDYQIPPVPGLPTIRELFHAKPGYELWHIDVSQAEVRVGAAITECEALLDGFRNGIDAHSRVTMEIFGIDQDDPEWKLYRMIGKTLNLAIQYFAGPKKIQAQLEKDTGKRWSFKKVKEFVDGWHRALPEISLGLEVAQHEAETLGYVRLWNGRLRWFAHQRGGFEPTYTAFNGKCQGGVAEVMKRIMWEWETAYPDTLLHQIHDALVIEVPADRGQAQATLCADLMVREFEKAMAKTWKRHGELVVMPFEAEIEPFGGLGAA